jgi:glycolate dehydrogenase iron-sulfur subunit
MSVNLNSFRISNPPSDADLVRCVHCGLCLNYCPTYRLTGLETESPRGRLFLIRELAEGHQDTNASFREHIDLCLGCRHCEAVCPSGVRFGHLLEAARSEIVERGHVGLMERVLRWIILKQIWPQPWRLGLVASLLQVYQRIGLQRLVRATRILNLLGRVGEMESLLPARRLQKFAPTQSSQKAGARPAALFSGCIMRVGFGDIHQASVRVLGRSGWSVNVPDEQVCCGALHLHAGERELAKELARRNIEAFTSDSAIVVNAAGCGAVLNEYGELLEGDPNYAERARAFSARVLDVSQALAQSKLPDTMRDIKLRVTYQEPCHLAHAQRIKKEPREILSQIPGIEFVELNASDRCCGSAGIYNILHPEIADQLIDEKIANIVATGADVVVTGNIGCLIQLEYGKARSGWKGRVMHLVELLDDASERNEPA